MFSLWRNAHAGKTVRPRGYWGLPAFASLSMAGSVFWFKAKHFLEGRMLYLHLGTRQIAIDLKGAVDLGRPDFCSITLAVSIFFKTSWQ